MTRKEQIEQAAVLDAGTCAMEDCWEYDLGFTQGAIWADAHPKSPWIDPMVELPQKNQRVFVKPWNGSIVVDMIFYTDKRFKLGIFKDPKCICSFYVDQVQYWMPFPSLPEE